ncbi:MAG: motility associated factor glycosyltransferase family protein [Fusobacteriota bacterium]
MLEKNLEYIKLKNKTIYNKLLKKSSKQIKEIEVIETKTGDYTAKLKKKLLHSMYRPKREATKLIKKHTIEDKDILLVFGFGFGYHIEELLKLKEERTKVFIFQDNLDVLYKAMEFRDLEKIFNRDDIYIFDVDQKYEMMQAIEQNFKIGLVPDYEIVKHKVEFEIYEKEYLKVLKNIKDILSSHLVNTSTIFEFSKMWQKNRFYNLKYFAKSMGVYKFFDEFKNIPIIIVAAGPSLDKNIKYLNWIKGKALIIAVGTVVKKLLSENINPDLIVSIDGGEANWEHFRRINYKKIPLLYELMINPKILDNHTGDKVVFASNDTVSSWGEEILGKKGFLKSGGTVALTCYDFAVRSGGNPVIFMGQDLAYSGGKTHASSTVYEEDKLENGRYNTYMEDIYGEKVTSDIKFKTFKEHFERYISIDKRENENLRVLDCTEGGAKIKGTQIMTIKEAYFKYIENKKIDFSNIIKSKRYKKKEYENKILILEKKKNQLIAQLEDMNEMISDAISIIKKAQKRDSYLNLDDLEKIESELQKSINTSRFMNSITQPVISKVMKETKKSKTMKDILKINLELYNGIKESLEYNLTYLRGE